LKPRAGVSRHFPDFFGPKPKKWKKVKKSEKKMC
jgi:hypothetical protein